VESSPRNYTSSGKHLLEKKRLYNRRILVEAYAPFQHGDVNPAEFWCNSSQSSDYSTWIVLNPYFFSPVSVHRRMSTLVPISDAIFVRIRLMRLRVHRLYHDRTPIPAFYFLKFNTCHEEISRFEEAMPYRLRM
jgi:hypothetical protein